MQQAHLVTAAELLADRLASDALCSEIVRVCMTEAYGGDDTTGAWIWRQAYDAVEAAVVLFLRKYGRAMRRKAGNEAAMLGMIEKLAGRLPSFTRRSEEQVELQQFSTPPALAFLVAVAAKIQPGDVVMEPSAGTGLLAIMAEIARGALILNELGNDRAALLEALWPDASVTDFNAEHIDDRLDAAVSPNVVIMNPPFSTSPGVRAHRSIVTDRHVASALRRLAPGGRLVTITGAGFEPAGLAEQGVQLVFSSAIDGKVFRRAGTNFETRLTVYDKAASGQAQPPSPWPDPASRPAELLQRLATLPERQPSAGYLPCKTPKASPLRASDQVRPAAPTDSTPFADAAPLDYDTIPGATPIGGRSERIYEPYGVERLRIPGAVDHPTPLVQSAAMASVLPPAVDYRPIIPPALVRDGLLSHAQLETVIHAGAAHAELLPGCYEIDPETASITLAADDAEDAARFRRGFSLGDATGTGKGRQLAGIILDNICQGRPKALWLSKSAKLVADARRDWADLRGDPEDIVDLGKIKPGGVIPDNVRILFLTYKLLASTDRDGRSRLQQILDWLGPVFGGVIAFDEAHAMANAAGGEEGLFGKPGKASQQGLAGLQLQLALPDARVVYASATGATRVKNLAYAARLGLWGHGAAFPTRNDFVEAMVEGGTAAMEVVARDLKAQGLYLARVLAFDGVEIKPLHHRLTTDQRRIYDTYAEAYQVIHQGLQEGLKATGVVAKNGAIRNAHAHAVAHSAFEGNKQRFFESLITSMMCPSLLRAIERDLANGDAAVIQLVSTQEAALNRRLAEIPTSTWNDVQIDCTPRQMIGDYLMTAFSAILQEEYQIHGSDEIRSRPVRDDDGNFVESRAAVEARDRLIGKIASLPPVEAALDQIINHFGEERVAEITGRTRRIVRKGYRQAVERRSAAANLADASAFMNDGKRILVFSDAGGTGRSFHADQTAENQRRRIHYLLQPGWRADNAIQGLGRTHRSNQRIAPVVRPCSTDVRGQKRFIATIARRLAELGALTRGQRQTGDNGIFRPKDNLESDYAKAALRVFLLDLCAGRIEGCSAGEFEQATGLRLFDRGGNRRNDLPPIQRVLNRMLALPIDLQNRLFDEFERRHTDRIAGAKEAGIYDIGLETLRADNIRLIKREIIVRHPGGTLTELVEVRCRHRLHPTSLGDALRDRAARPVRNKQSGRVAVVRPGPSFTDIDGVSRERLILIRPRGTERISKEAFEDSSWAPFDQDEHARAWAAEVGRLPSHEERSVYLATGLLLPLWKQLPLRQLQVRRLTTDDGQTFLGLLLDVEGLQAFLDAVGHGGARPELGAEDVRRGAMERQGIIGLANGWHLRRTLQMGRSRLELVGPTDLDRDQLKAFGVTIEIVSFKARYWIPLDEGLVTLKKILETHPPRSSEGSIDTAA